MRTVLATAVLAAALAHPAIALAQDSSMPASGATTTAPSDPAVQSDATTTPPPAAADADAGSNGTHFRGIRIEGDVGGSRFAALGDHHDKFGYGATVGFDGQLGKRIVIGAEGSYWRANNTNEVCTETSAGGGCARSGNEWGAAVRVGYLLTPRFLVFGKGGYVSNNQTTHYYANTPGQSYYFHDNTDGYQYGGGIEYDLTNMRFPVYVNVQYVRSEYNDSTHQDKLFAGIGFHFK